ncbi:MAG: HD domain-containing protein [Planctomycetota bacterium]|nr:HD domain-containing protein [Planctomycetota bacterium]
MNDPLFSSPDYFHGVNLFADPIHTYIPVTYPAHDGEVCERDIIDSPWVQRLRRIHQLQSAWWVYPGAEHSRFIHSLGVMHCAGYFARKLFDSLKGSLEKRNESCPSYPLLEETVRLAGLLHDLGHGPFSHFFDDEYLSEYGITHEDLSKHLILDYFGEQISQLRRSPTARFEESETVNPEHVAFLIKKPARPEEVDESMPLWVRWLQPLFCGIYTVDNIDYSLRDAYMCGISSSYVDMERLRFYTFFTDNGLTFHHAGLSALEMFLKSRWYLYRNVYYHRTVRGIDRQLSFIFRDTIEQILGGDPRKNLDKYLTLTDYSLLETVNTWHKSDNVKRRGLASDWRKVVERKVMWKSVFEAELPIHATSADEPINPGRIRAAIYDKLPPRSKDIVFEVHPPVTTPVR